MPEGSGKSSGLPGLVPADGFPVSPGRASSFSHARKGTKSAHRGTNPSDKGRPPGFGPLCTPFYGGVKSVRPSNDRRAPADTPHHARRPPAFCRLALQSSAPPMGAWCGCSSLWALRLRPHPPRCARHLLLKEKAFGTAGSFAFPLRGRWHSEAVTDEVLWPHGPTQPGAYPGPQAPKHTDAEARRASGEAVQPRVKDAGKRSTQCN